MRISLDSSRYTCTFTWPESGDPFSRTEMQTPYELEDDGSVKYTVAFTKFPGVKLVDARRRSLEPEIAYKAYVVLRAESVKPS